MGRPAPEYAVAVVDDDGAPVGADGDGELQVRGVRGVSLFAEYLHAPTRPPARSPTTAGSAPATASGSIPTAR